MSSEMKTGVALSGGGVRAAGFSSGVMRYILQHGIDVDYLSTVSGGGYIGASYMDWKFKNNQKDDPQWHHDFFEHIRKNCDYLISWRNPGRGILDIFTFSCVIAMSFLIAMLTAVSFAFPFSFIIDFCLGDILRGGFLCPDNSTNLVIPDMITDNVDTEAGCVMQRANSNTYLLFACLLFLLIIFYILSSIFSNNSLRSKARVMYLATGVVLLLTFLPWFIEEFLASNTSLYVNGIILFGSIFLWLGIPPLRTKAAVAALVYLYAYVIKWKVYKSAILFMSYNEDMFTWGVVASAGIIWLSPFMGMLKNASYHTFYRWRLQKAFFFPLSVGGTGCSGITLYECFPFCGTPEKEWKNLDEKALTMADLNGMRPKYICNTVVHQWKKSAESPRSFSVLLFSPDKIERIDETAEENLFAGLLNPSDIMLSDAMATSAAAVGSDMGNFENQSVRTLQLLIGFSLSKSFYANPRGDVAGSTWVIFRILPFLIQLLLVLPLILIPVVEKHMTDELVLWFLIVLGLFSLLASIPVGSGNRFDTFVRWWIVNIYHIQALRRVLHVVNTGTTPPPILSISDGGHVDNTGLLPLLKKRVDRIVLADSSSEFGGTYTAADLKRSLQLARDFLNCTFTGMAGEDIISDLDWKYVKPPNGYKPRYYHFKVQYHDYSLERSEFVQVGEAEIIVLKARHPNEGCASIGEDVLSWDSYTQSTGLELDKEKWGTGPKLGAHDVDRLTGCCCELCHSACMKTCCSPISGQFPEHSTLNMTFTPAMFTAYHREAYRGAVEASIKEFLAVGRTEEKKDPIETQPY